MTGKGTSRQVFICLRLPPLLGFCLGVIEQFCRFRIWSETECKTTAEFGLQHDSTPSAPSQPHTVCIYCTVTQRRGAQ
jgi:hypothetical protein